MTGLRIFDKDRLRQPDAQKDPGAVPGVLTAIPYFAWANREEGDMAVWIEEAGQTCRETGKDDPW